MAFNGGGDGGVRWRQQRLRAFNGVGDGLRQEDERAAQGQATQQPASTMRGREGGATRGRQEMMAQQPACATRQQEAAQLDKKTTRQREGGASRGNATTSRRDERTRGRRGAQREDKERQCDNKLARQVDERVAQREDGERQCYN